MDPSLPSALVIIAGRGAYPWLLAQSARKQGVNRLLAVAFRRETDSCIEKYADDVMWIRLGRLGDMLEALGRSGIRHAVMAGQITPTHLFRVRPDARLLALLAQLRVRNAETIFGAVAEELRRIGIELLPASTFMEEHMPEAGVLTQRVPTETERHDMELGFRIAEVTSRLDIGQTVVVKGGTVLAVEAFEGTDETIRRAGRLGGPGSVVVKVAKRGHDMRFDIPVIGRHTIRVLHAVRASALAMQARRAIVLEREAVIREADRLGITLVALPLQRAP